MSEQARLIIDRDDDGAFVRVRCDHGGTVSYWFATQGQKRLAETITVLLGLYDKDQHWHRWPDCQCSTAELWARYGNRPEKEGA